MLIDVPDVRRVHGSAIIYSGVKWKGSCDVGPFAVVGEASRGKQPGDLTTVIGDEAHIRSHSVIYHGNQIGSGLETGHGVLIRELCEIGDNVSLGTGTVIEHHVKIGNRVRLHSNVFVPEYSVLEDSCWLGPNVVLTNAKYPRSARAKDTLHGPIIEANAKIGANATLLPGVTVGRGSLVGAGAVVTHNVPPGMVVVGNPARVSGPIARLPYAQE